jgi:hypothetical protein
MHNGTNEMTNKGLGFKVTNSTIFCESMIYTGFNQKTIKVDLHVRVIMQFRDETNVKRFQKTREDSTPKREMGHYHMGPAGPTCRPPGPWAQLSASLLLRQFPTGS